MQRTWVHDQHYSVARHPRLAIIDEPDGVLYVPAGNPAPDFDAELRMGYNLYTDSVIAIDAATGRMLGYNQVVKRDSHDWDVDTAPTLATTRSGKRIVASANRDSLLSILDRSRVTRGATPARSHGCPPAPVADADDKPRERGRAAFEGSRWSMRSKNRRIAASASPSDIEVGYLRRRL